MSVVDVKVWGEYACFTRPEFKVERVSYPVMTPSAARGILEAIYWKPQIYYHIRRIGILKEGSQWSLLRNEISSKQSDRGQPILIDGDRQQRTSLILTDVAYRIQAWIVLRNGENNIGKHLDTFRRRAESGQYFHKPYLGCREFAACYELLGDISKDDKKNLPDENYNREIGTMLYDTAYIRDLEYFNKHPEDQLEFVRHEKNNGDDLKHTEVKGYAKRFFFNAVVKNGWLVEKDKDSLPDSIHNEIMRLEV